MRQGPPPADVVQRFGLPNAEAVPLVGGQATVYRLGPAVFKRVEVSAEVREVLEWQARLLAAIDGRDDVRVAPPIRALDGTLVVDGWTAWRYEPGDRAHRRWLDVIDAGRRLHRHTAAWTKPAFMAARTDAWARADRIAWGDESFDPASAPYLRQVFSALAPVRARCQVVHADLTGNVHLHDGLPPVVLDFSPYWRPTAFASAVVVVDAILFEDAPSGLVDEVAAEEGPEFAQCLLRAVLFRALTDHLRAPRRAREHAGTYGGLIGRLTRGSAD